MATRLWLGRGPFVPGQDPPVQTRSPGDDIPVVNALDLPESVSNVRFDVQSMEPYADAPRGPHPCGIAIDVRPCATVKHSTPKQQLILKWFVMFKNAKTFSRTRKSG